MRFSITPPSRDATTWSAAGNRQGDDQFPKAVAAAFSRGQ